MASYKELTTRVWTPSEEDIDNDLLIDEVEVRELLYDKTHPDYLSVPRKTTAWEEIAAEVFHSSWSDLSQLQKTEACKCLQRRWKNIRACFSRELREQRNEQAAQARGKIVKKRRKYLHYERLEFLQRTLEANELNESILTPQVVLQEEENEAIDGSAENSRELFEPKRKKRKARTTQATEQETPTSEERQLDILGERPEVADQEPMNHFLESSRSVVHCERELGRFSEAPRSVQCDQEMNFALSLVPLLKELPKESRLKTEIGILQLIHNETTAAAERRTEKPNTSD